LRRSFACGCSSTPPLKSSPACGSSIWQRPASTVCRWSISKAAASVGSGRRTFTAGPWRNRRSAGCCSCISGRAGSRRISGRMYGRSTGVFWSFWQDGLRRRRGVRRPGMRRAVPGLRLPGGRDRRAGRGTARIRRRLPLEALDGLLPSCDVVVVTVPLDAETTQLLDEERFGRMKKSSVLVSMSRAGWWTRGRSYAAEGRPDAGRGAGRLRDGAPAGRQPPLGHGKT
jgi:hypothetical protein